MARTAPSRVQCGMFRDTALRMGVAMGVALALFAGACKEDAAPPAAKAAAADGPAGVVVHVAGEVTAARPGEQPRPLEQDAAVSADDTITTGPDGEVSIQLTHNKVRWDVGSGM